MNVDNEGQRAAAERSVLGQVEIQPLADMAVGGVLDIFKRLGVLRRNKRGNLEIPHEIGFEVHLYLQQELFNLCKRHTVV